MPQIGMCWCSQSLQLVPLLRLRPCFLLHVRIAHYVSRPISPTSRIYIEDGSIWGARVDQPFGIEFRSAIRVPDGSKRDFGVQFEHATSRLDCRRESFTNLNRGVEPLIIVTCTTWHECGVPINQKGDL